MPKGLRAGSSTTTLWRISSTTLHGYQQEGSSLRHQVRPYKQNNFRIMIPYYVCDVKYPILSASRLLDSTTLHHHTWTTTSTPHKTLRTFLPTSREDRHPYRIRHLANDYRQWKIHCCGSTYRESSTTTRTNRTTHPHRPRTTTDPWWKH